MVTRYNSWMIWYAIALHAFWGVLLLIDERAGFVTAIHMADRWIPGGGHAEGWVMLVVAALAGWAIVKPPKNDALGLLLLIPQQAVLVLSAIGAIVAISSSSFADGVVRPRAFIAADQCPALLACVCHTFAIFGLHAHAVLPWTSEGKGWRPSTTPD